MVWGLGAFLRVYLYSTGTLGPTPALLDNVKTTLPTYLTVCARTGDVNTDYLAPSHRKLLIIIINIDVAVTPMKATTT